MDIHSLLRETKFEDRTVATKTMFVADKSKEHNGNTDEGPIRLRPVLLAKEVTVRPKAPGSKELECSETVLIGFASNISA